MDVIHLYFYVAIGIDFGDSRKYREGAAAATTAATAATTTIGITFRFTNTITSWTTINFTFITGFIIVIITSLDDPNKWKRMEKCSFCFHHISGATWIRLGRERDQANSLQSCQGKLYLQFNLIVVVVVVVVSAVDASTFDMSTIGRAWIDSHRFC